MMNKAKKKINDIDKTNWNQEDIRHTAPSLWYFNNDTDPATRTYPKTLKNPPKHIKKQDFHGAFIYQVPAALITRYTCQGDTILDLFGGSKTTQRAAAAANRNSILVDIAWNKRNKFLNHKKSNTWHIEVSADSTDARLPGIIASVPSKSFNEDKNTTLLASLTILHPPYYDIIKFSSPKIKGDLSHLSMEAFESSMHALGTNAYNMTKPGGFIALVFGDIYKKGVLYPAYKIADTLINNNGYIAAKGITLKAVFIKNVTGNEAKGINRGLWEYRALVNGFAYFSHESIFLWRKSEK